MLETTLLRKYTSGISASSVEREADRLEIEGVARSLSRQSSENLKASYDSQEKQFPFDCEYREIYLNLQQKAYHCLSLADCSTPTLDTWEVDIEIAVMILSESPLSSSSSDWDEVEKVISNSDILKKLFNSLPEHEYRIKASEYIIQIYNWAEKLHQWRRAGKNNSQDSK